MCDGVGIIRAIEAYERYVDACNRVVAAERVEVATFSQWVGEVAPWCHVGCVGSRDNGVIGALDVVKRVEGPQVCSGRDVEASQDVVSGVTGADDEVVDRKCDVEKVDVIGGVGERGRNWERNREWRAQKKLRKRRKQGLSPGVGGQRVRAGFSSCAVDVRQGFFSECGDEVRAELRESRARRLVAENNEAAVRSQRRLDVLESVDLKQEKELRRAKLVALTERNMVSIERDHAKLVSSGDVPGDMRGFAATIVGGSISPISSVSDAEVRRCQKALSDAEKEIRDLKLERVELARNGYVRGHDKDIWTDNSENHAILDEMYPDGYGEQDMTNFGLVGKFRLV